MTARAWRAEMRLRSGFASEFHQERLNEFIQVAIQDALCIGGFITSADVFYHLVWVQHIVPDLASPLDLFLASFNLCYFFPFFPEFDLI